MKEGDEETISGVMDSLDESKINLGIERDNWFAVCSPEINNDQPSYSAPFDFQVYGTPPADIGRVQIANEFSEQFTDQIDEVYEQVTEAEEPLNEIIEQI